MPKSYEKSAIDFLARANVTQIYNEQQGQNDQGNIVIKINNGFTTVI